MQNPELRRELSKISALAEAIAGLAAHTHADSLEPAMAELVVAVRDAYEGLIDRAVVAGAVASIEDREDAESRAPCGGR